MSHELFFQAYAQCRACAVGLSLTAPIAAVCTRHTAEPTREGGPAQQRRAVPEPARAGPLNKGGRCQNLAHRARVTASASVRACIRRRPLAATQNKKNLLPNHPTDRAPAET